MQNFPVNTLKIKIWYNWLGEILPMLMTGCIIILYIFHSVVPISVMENSLLMTMKSILKTASFAV